MEIFPMKNNAAHTWSGGERTLCRAVLGSERLFAEEKFEGFVRDPCCGFGRIPDSARAAGLMTYASTSSIVATPYRIKCRIFSMSLRKMSLLLISFASTFNIAERFALHALSFQSVRKVA